LKKFVVRNAFLAGLALVALIISGSQITVSAQRSDDRTIDQAQRAVRQRIVNQEGGRSVTVSFNTDAQTEFRSRSAVRVRGTGNFSHSSNSSRYNGGRSREFSYEAIVNPYRYGSVTGIKYDMATDRRDNDGLRIYQPPAGTATTTQVAPSTQVRRTNRVERSSTKREERMERREVRRGSVEGRAFCSTTTPCSERYRVAPLLIRISGTI